jgi:AI-2 transport protein TqsA
MATRQQSEKLLAAIKETRMLVFFLAILVVIALGFVLDLLQAIFQPLLIALFLSFLFEQLVDFFVKFKIPKFFSFVIAIVIIFVVIYLLGLFIYASVASFTTEYPKYQTKFVNFYQNLLLTFKIPHERVQTYLNELNWADVWTNLSVSSFLSKTIGNFITFLSNLFLIFIFAIYIVLGKRHMLDKIDKAFPEERAQLIYQIISNINKGLQKYLVAKLMISFSTAVTATVILLLFGVDFALVWGLLTLMLDFIPNIGSIIATIFPILVAFFQFGSVFPALWVAILLVTTQSIWSNIIEPRVVGKSLNLSPLVVIFSLTFWAFIWGPIGMILAIPISATIQIICANIESLKPISIIMGGD